MGSREYAQNIKICRNSYDWINVSGHKSKILPNFPQSLHLLHLSALIWANVSLSNLVSLPLEKKMKMREISVYAPTPVNSLFKEL